MPRKTGRKSRSRRQRVQKRVFSIERGLFRAGSMGLFLFGLLVLIYIGLTSDIVLLVAIASIAIFVWGAVVLPVDRFQDLGAYLWDGEFGHDVHDWWVKLMPWRGR
ncbi:hypothetical protein NDI85_20070 [Halomicroarcula sp. S1AR25-4]|uniref:hypothetical protein n=1 Tax=Haloarcula sp. S1AR25-4 TaxID=2950538 RepID=UPI00287685A0|nr:hypothetical protein [Halomicroarcula sp. S1AR25-4]MDS0280086.1 hypothetical protein [Halomicroarcula sp. S1AR25-4]